jgi:hypothetical protein
MAMTTPTSRRAVMATDLAAKAALVVLLLAALLWPDLSGLKGKATGARLVVYPLGVAVLPVWWVVVGRTRRHLHRSFPWHADLLITLPWLADLAGNRLDLFDTISWWDDLMHFALWGLLTAGVLVAFAPRHLSRGMTTMVGLGFGATAAVVWELGEYVTFVRNSPELVTAYTDTLGDLLLGTLGALLAALTVFQVRRSQPRLDVPDTAELFGREQRRSG